MNLRIFLAHPKKIGDEEIETLAKRATAALTETVSRLSPGTTVEVVTGRDDFMARSVTEGGWEPWCTSVARGVTYRENTLQPRFDAIVVAPSPILGRGTAQIVQDALRGQKPVYYLRENGALLPVRNVVIHDPNDWQNGWGVDCG